MSVSAISVSLVHVLSDNENENNDHVMLMQLK